MPEFRVMLQADIEADTLDEAIEIALDRGDATSVNVALKVIEVLDEDGTSVASSFPDFVVIDDDHEPSLGTLDNMVVLEMTAYRALLGKPAAIVDSLCDIDFFADSDDWVRGTFYHVSEIPERCTHLREIARDMRLPE